MGVVRSADGRKVDAMIVEMMLISAASFVMLFVGLARILFRKGD